MAHVTHELDVPCEQLHSRAWLTRNEVGDARCPCRCAKARPVRNGSVEPVHEQQSLHHIVHVSNERCALRASAEPKAKRTVMLIVRGRVPSCTMYTAPCCTFEICPPVPRPPCTTAVHTDGGEVSRTGRSCAHRRRFVARASYHIYSCILSPH